MDGKWKEEEDNCVCNLIHTIVIASARPNGKEDREVREKKRKKNLSFTLFIKWNCHLHLSKIENHIKDELNKQLTKQKVNGTDE